ncbi:MAG: iron-containing redox enzyme family protein, partial [Thermoplasmatales archaeon]|nr:iron-containing redox enzyme family protein [Thermoplasmatales archaeon]
YAYESIFPEVAAEKARGLATHYGVRSRRALEFFRVHAEADVAHSTAERTVLRTEIARSNAARRAALRATERTVGAWWHFLDAFAR